MDKVFIYWDNSNIFISAQQVAALIDGTARFRVGFSKLIGMPEPDGK